MTATRRAGLNATTEARSHRKQGERARLTRDQIAKICDSRGGPWRKGAGGSCRLWHQRDRRFVLGEEVPDDESAENIMTEKNKVVQMPAPDSVGTAIEYLGDGAAQILTRRQNRQRYWKAYLDEGTATYEQRTLRYQAVAQILQSHGLADNDLVVDVGAGRTQFDYFLRVDFFDDPLRRLRRWRGRYLAVDGALDGTDLNDWAPQTEAEFFVAIEVLEHLKQPHRLMEAMVAMCTKAVVVTTPNPDAVDVLAMDPTHVTPISARDFNRHGWCWELVSLFGTKDDTILAWRGALR